MNPDAATLWRRPRSALAALLACLGMLGAFSIDTYIPAFSGIARSLGATPVQMQQTLSAYLLGFAVMNLFHGALSDSFGRRPVVLLSNFGLALDYVLMALAPSLIWLFVGRLISGVSDRTLMSQHGTVGLQVRKIQEMRYQLPAHALLVAHSDGILTRWGVVGALVGCAFGLWVSYIKHDEIMRAQVRTVPLGAILGFLLGLAKVSLARRRA